MMEALESSESALEGAHLGFSFGRWNVHNSPVSESQLYWISHSGRMATGFDVFLFTEAVV